MGLLDDAIREHLELKRRTGADPEEVDRQAREALGPVVRGDELVTDVTSDTADGVSSDYEPLGHDFDSYDHGDALESGVDLAVHPDDFAPIAPEAVHDAGAGAEAAPSPHAGQPTEEFDVEAAHASEEPARQRAAEQAEPAVSADHKREPQRDRGGASDGEGDHDVLEDTPDFLQETPEHDRLWFEQAPPQDFDFDK